MVWKNFGTYYPGAHFLSAEKPKEEPSEIENFFVEEG